MRIRDESEAATVEIPRGARVGSWGVEGARGLSLTIKNGRRLWDFRWTRSDGKRAALRLGEFPTMGMVRAIEEADKLRARLRSGIDPTAAARAQRVSARAQRAAAGAWIDERFRLSAIASTFLTSCESRGVSPGGVKKYRVGLAHIIDSDEFAAADVRALDRLALASLLATKSPAVASNAYASLRACLSFAVERGALDTNPLLGRRGTMNIRAVTPRTRFLDGAELHRFQNEIGGIAKMSDEMKVILRLQLLLGLRVGEIASLDWSWIDLRRGIIEHPADAMKARAAATTALSQSALRLILEHARATGAKPSRAGRVFPDATAEDVIKVLARSGWSLRFGTHDLRRTVATWLQRLGVSEEVRRAILNHARPGGIGRSYDHDRLVRQQRDALERWAQALDSLASDPRAFDDERDGAHAAVLDEFADVLR